MITELPHWRTADKNGMVFPWYTRACCEWLSTLKLNGKRVFEFGSGQSAVWWKEQGCKVTGVDHQKEWADLAGVDWITDKEGYLNHIRYKGFQDIICIDGEWRDECMEFALMSLEEDGIIIIDNYHQGSCDLSEWPNTDALIEKCGLKVTEYREPLHEDWMTIVITRDSGWVANLDNTTVKIP